MKLTEQELDAMKFPAMREHEFVKQCKVTSLPELSAVTNMYGNCVTLFAERKRDWGKSWTEYSVVVNGDEYGETCDEVTFSRGTTVAEAKAKAIELARMYVKQGLLNI